MSLLILLAATLGGTVLTWLFDDDAPLVVRLGTGAPLGVTLLGLVGFVLASAFGLTTGTVLAATVLVTSPLLLLSRPTVRSRAVGDFTRLGETLRTAYGRPAAWGIAVLMMVAALLVVRLYDRAFFVAPDGGLHTGLDHNLGDLPYHLAIITSFAEGKNYPPEHPELAGARLTYPFLVDFVTAQLVRAGASLRDAFLAQSVLLALALLVTLHRFARLLSGGALAAAVAVILVSASGGLGWWRLFDDVDPSAGGLLGHLRHLSHDYTILHSGELRWGNIFVCMLIPQRSLLLGMPLFLAGAAQWWRVLAEGELSRRRLLGAGALAGLLPLAHAHSFLLAVVLGSALFLLFRKVREGLVFLAAALLVAAPQVIWLAVGSSMKAAGFVAIELGWDHGAQTPLRFWFWNLGLFLPLSVLALLWRGARPVVERRLLLFYVPFALCFVVPNVFRLSPWMWDNIKFLVYWHLAAAVLVALLLARLFEHGRGGRVLAAGLLGALTLSGALDLWRVASRTIDHELYEPAAVAFARRIAVLTPPRAIVLHATTFKSEVYLTGRRSVLGYGGHMWSQGLDAGTRETDIKALYTGAPDTRQLLDRYQVDYILLGPREREAGAIDAAFAGFPIVAEAGDRTLSACLAAERRPGPPASRVVESIAHPVWPDAFLPKGRARMADTEAPAAKSRSGSAKGNGRAGRARPGRSARATVAVEPTPAAERAAKPQRTKPDPTPAAPDFSPSRYIAVIDRHTGKEVERTIDPDDLLVHAHRDQHPVEVAAQYVASRFIQLTGREHTVDQLMRQVNNLGAQAAEGLGFLTGSARVTQGVKRVLGVVYRDVHFQFREYTHLSEREVKARVEKEQREARAALKARGRNPRLQVLLTGATGFLGKEILTQAADDRRIQQIVAVVRPETIRDHKTKQVVKVLSPAQRGALLLKRLHLKGARARKFRFIEGDIEKPDLGIAPAELETLRKTLTHVIHCAASVSFDDTYENSYRANVLGCRNALAFSKAIQATPGTPFVCHVAIETSYIHGRKRHSIAQENALVFPRHFYNNFYELTKAMASIETDRALIEDGLRVTQLLPSIVIGDSRTGNNRGDTKVVNAPINAFGRAKEATDKMSADPLERFRTQIVARVANTFPGDSTAELNLVPVDRVVAGILAALTVPEAIGQRVHLATDNRIRSEDMVRITREELGANVRLADPTLYRNVTLPLVKTALNALKEPKLANALEKLGTIFGAYGEWGQPIHDVGNDVRILGLPIRRPSTLHAFRMLCRHNRYVQEYGRVRDADEIARREKVWDDTIDRIEFETGHEAGAMDPAAFRTRMAELIDLRPFELRSAARQRSQA